MNIKNFIDLCKQAPDLLPECSSLIHSNDKIKPSKLVTFVLQDPARTELFLTMLSSDHENAALHQDCERLARLFEKTIIQKPEYTDKLTYVPRIASIRVIIYDRLNN